MSWDQARERFAAAFEHYEPRQAQTDLAHAIEAALAEGRPLLAQAPTATGKSFVLLTTLLDHARNSGQPSVAATATKLLQDQYIEDAKTIRELYDPSFNFLVLKGRANYACFRGDTRVLTWDGARRIADLARDGYAVLLDGDRDWVKAEVKSFGHQQLWRIRLTRDGVVKEIFTTKEHRWFVNPNANFARHDETVTAELSPGSKLAHLAPLNVVTDSRLVPSPQGIAHGIVFGDGTNFGRRGFRRGVSGTLALYGDKKELHRFFPLNRWTEFDPGEKYRDRLAIRISDIPNGYKTMPSLDESPSYLYGWLVGLMATDGSVSKSYSISSSRREVLQHVRDICTQLGVITYPISSRSRVGIHQDVESEIYSVTIAAETVSDDFLVRSDHIVARSVHIDKRTYRQWRAARRWTVVSVEPTEEIEEVYCAVVPTTQSFVLEDNILTGNCMAKMAKADEVLLDLKLDELMRAAEQEDVLGDVERLPYSLNPVQKRALTMSSDECPGKNQCRFGSVCFAERAKERAQTADVVIVNHALLAVDALLKAQGVAMLPAYGALGVDEAHDLVSYVTNALSDEVTRRSLGDLNRDVATWLGQPDLIPFGELVFDQLFARFAELLASDHSAALTPALVVELGEQLTDVLAHLDLLSAKAAAEPAQGEDEVTRKRRLRKRLDNLLAKLRRIVLDDFADTVRWIEKDAPEGNRRDRGVLLKTAPLSVAPFLARAIWPYTTPILLSATLALSGDFTYMAREVGLDARPYGTFDCPSPFDYTRQACTYLPKDIPDPRKNRSAFQAATATIAHELIKASDGRAMLLFTSWDSLNYCHAALAPKIEAMGHRVFRQGEMSSTQQLARAFAADEHSVLLGTRSFFQGVNIPGDSLRLLIIEKLPFHMPDVLWKARCDAIDAKLTNKWSSASSFNSLMLPDMMITLLQGYGRLIRSMSDTGMVALLDPAVGLVGGKNYGKRVRAALPDAPIVTDLAEAVARLRALERQAEDDTELVG